MQESRPAALIVMLLHAYLSEDFAYVTCKRGRGVGVAKGTAIVVKGIAESPNRYSVGGGRDGVYMVLDKAYETSNDHGLPDGV